MTGNSTSSSEDPASLRDINTEWSLLRLAHEDATSGSDAARRAMLLRYGPAVRRYVAVVVRDPHAADEVAQDVMVRMMRGDFGVADPKRGRFRDLLRHSVRNMVRNYYSKENRRRGVELDESLEPAGDDAPDDPWLSEWVRTLLDSTWRALERYQAQTSGSVPYTVLKLREEFPGDESDVLAERLSQKSGKTFNAAGARQQLRRARLRFAQLLIEEVAQGLRDPSPDAVEDELINLGLMEYVRDFLPDDWKETGLLKE